jgi:hypothetical protein
MKIINKEYIMIDSNKGIFIFVVDDVTREDKENFIMRRLQQLFK